MNTTDLMYGVAGIFGAVLLGSLLLLAAYHAMTKFQNRPTSGFGTTKTHFDVSEDGDVVMRLVISYVDEELNYGEFTDSVYIFEGPSGAVCDCGRG